MKHLATLLMILLLSIGCGPQFPTIPDGAWPSEDGGVLVVCGEDSDVSADFHNCGACGNQCDTADTDRCEVGTCRCGLRAPCIVGSDCRAGVCVPVDPFGDVCEFDRDCLHGYACIESRCSWVECVDEVCDGYDNDCDGLVDNIGSAPLSEYCSGDMRADPTTIVEPCSVGTRVCTAGVWGECFGDTPPVPETGLLACDGIDNDCDTCVDGALVDGVCMSRAPVGFDILFAIDTSGSMSDNIAIVKQAVRLFSSRLSGMSFRYGIVHVPGERAGLAGLFLNFTDFSTFETALSTMTTGSGSTEPQYDAIVQSLDGRLGLTWRGEHTKIIILFTDEPATGSGHSREVTTEEGMCAVVAPSGTVLVPVVPLGLERDYDMCSWTSVELPAGGAGSTLWCVSDSECFSGETCGDGVCVSQLVIDTVDALESVLGNPCGV